MNKSKMLICTAVLAAMTTSLPLAAQTTTTDDPAPQVTGTEDALQPMTENGITYVSGGVSDEEQAKIKAMGQDYNLMVLMAADEGNYFGSGDVTLTDDQGNTVLQTTTDGPMLFAKVPPGSYTVEASVVGNTQNQTVDVGDSGQAEARFTF